MKAGIATTLLQHAAARSVPDRHAARVLPTGTVTFLFTDIEGSTRLLAGLRDGYAEVLLDHRRLLRDSFRRWGGIEVDSQGDSFFVAFSRASDALGCAIDVQRTVATHAWSNGADVRVRTGLHTADAHPAGAGYVGLGVHRAARIASIAHGGQIVLSTATASIVADELPDSTDLRDLGEHRLRDLARPDRLFQVLHPELRADFPPLAGHARPLSNVPTAATPLVGRGPELAALGGLLRAPSVRLVTLTGGGGAGKTRLAVEVARCVADAFPGGTVFVDLAGVTDPDAVPGHIAGVLGAAPDPAGSVSPVERIAAELGDRQVLLVLDNFEHVDSAAPAIGDLVARCGGVTVLVTSRRPLRLRAEHVMPVRPLAVPPSDVAGDAAEVGRFDAVRLFVDRARAACPGFTLTDENAAAVGEICRRLHGLPLAIELAAGRLTLFSPHGLRDRLDDPLAFLAGGPVDLPARQRSLRASLDWSYALLRDAERRVLALLSASPGATVETVERLASETGIAGTFGAETVDAIAGLVDLGLVVREGSTNRLGMWDAVRRYAGERLEERAAVRPAVEQRPAATAADTPRPVTPLDGFRTSPGRRDRDLARPIRRAPIRRASRPALVAAGLAL